MSNLPYGGKRRGRPPKPKTNQTPYPKELFDSIAETIVGLAKDHRLWQRAKEAVVARADSDKALSPVSRIVLNFYLHHINRSEGRDWHGAETIAVDRCRSVRSVERANEELVGARYIVRRERRVKAFRASRPWETTIPAIIDAARKLNDPTGKSSTTRQETRQGPTNKSLGPDKQCAQGPDKSVGLTSKYLTSEINSEESDRPSGRVCSKEGQPAEQERRSDPRKVPEDCQLILDEFKRRAAEEESIKAKPRSERLSRVMTPPGVCEASPALRQSIRNKGWG